MNYSYEMQATDIAPGFLIGVGVYSLLCILLIASMYKIFKKSGRKGWESLIPFYNTIVMIQIAELPIWYIVLYFIPFANIYAIFKIFIEFAHKFGKSTIFGVASVFFGIVCFPILAFGKAQYHEKMPITSNPNSMLNSNLEPPKNTGDNYNQTVGLNNDEVSGLNNNIRTEVQNTPIQIVEPVLVQPNTQVSPVVPEAPAVSAQTVSPEVPVVTSVSEEVPSMITEETPVISNPEINQPAVSVEPAVNTIINEPDVNATETPAQNSKKFCPQCGNQVDQNDAICFMCGQQF